MKTVISALAPVLLCAATTACSCATAFERDAAAEAGVRDTGAETPDAGAPESGLADGGVCQPSALPPRGCASDAECQAWGAAVAPPGTYPVTMCSPRPDNPYGNCTNGATNCFMDARETRCFCTATSGCAVGFICVSDIPGGPTRCAQQCEGH